MKNRMAFAILIAAAVILAMSVIGVAFAASSGAGSSEDPLVTKSYVDGLYKELEAKIASSSAIGGAPAAGSSFVVVEVPAGKSVIGEGGTELVLRSGQATAIDNGVDGVSDLTAAKDLKGGTQISANHLLLVPRSDGRGIKCGTLCYVMVKGAYTLE